MNNQVNSIKEIYIVNVLLNVFFTLINQNNKKEKD